MKTIKPKVSVIMAVYGAEKYLSQAIESVLNQTFSDFELIVINDCSPDNSLEIIKRYCEQDKRIVFVNNKVNLGPSGTRNVGLKLCRGDYIAIFDNDDVCMPDRLEKQVKFLDNNPNIFLVAGSYQYIDETSKLLDNYIKSYTSDEVKILLPEKNLISHPTVMYRNAGYSYREKLDPAEDYDLWLRMMEDGKNLYIVKDVLIKYRIQGKSVTHTNNKKMNFLLSKTKEFYSERIKTGRDSYDSLDLNSVDLKMTERDISYLLNRRKIGFYFKNNSDMREFRKMLIDFWKKYGVLSWPRSIIFFIVSFLPNSLIAKLKKMVRK